jgi:hypothetical protein
MSFGSFFKSLGQKIVSGAKYIGQQAGEAIGVGIKGLKYITDKADQYSFGLTSFIPYYGAVKAGIDIADDVYKLASGEEKFNWKTAGRMGFNLGMGLLSKYTGAYEVRAIKGAARTFKSARTAGMSLKQASGLGARTFGRAYIPTTGDIKSSFAFVRAGGSLARGAVAQKNLVGVAGAVARGADKAGEAIKAGVKSIRTGTKVASKAGVPSYAGFGPPPTNSLGNLIQ